MPQAERGRGIVSQNQRRVGQHRGVSVVAPLGEHLKPNVARQQLIKEGPEYRTPGHAGHTVRCVPGPRKYRFRAKPRKAGDHPKTAKPRHDHRGFGLVREGVRGTQILLMAYFFLAPKA
jgi:hypothetical protein